MSNSASTSTTRTGLQSSAKQGLAWRFWRELRTNPVLIVAVTLFLAFVLIAVLAEILSPHALDAMNLRQRLLPPSFTNGHLLGTDELGRDVFTRILHGVRSSLFIAGTAVFIAALAGGGIGLMAGYYGGWLDSIIMRLVDMQLAIPTFFFALAGSVLLGPGVLNMIMVLAFVSWAEFARIARGSTLAVREEPFVEAAKSLGAGDWRINLTHVLPNIAAPLLVVFSVKVPHTILIEASLSFIGMGLPPTVPSLGAMINQGFNHMLSGSWWISIVPGTVLMLLVLSINTITDSLRDAVDIRL